MKYLSVFSGIGGFELGIQYAHESICIGYSEINKYASEVYQSHFPDHKNYGDITKIDEFGLPDFELLCGGFPCQSFSIAGKRGGFEDTRGTLFFDIARIAKYKRPRLIFLENVKGLLSHDSGRTFNTIISTLDELGYDIQWQVLNSKYFGVPQNRERVFIIGHLRGTPRPQVFPFTDDGESSPELSGHIANTLTARYEGAQAVGTYIGESELNEQKIKQINKARHDYERIYDTDGIAPTINTGQRGNAQPKIMQRSRGFNKGGEHNIAPTMGSSSWDHNNLLLQGGVRRLTPKECERLQGFPDDWTNCISDSQRYKCLGNAVTVNVIKAIAIELLK